MALTYQSGEEIHLGDRVSYGGSAGTIELVVERARVAIRKPIGSSKITVLA